MYFLLITFDICCFITMLTIILTYKDSWFCLSTSIFLNATFFFLLLIFILSLDGCHSSLSISFPRRDLEVLKFLSSYAENDLLKSSYHSLAKYWILKSQNVFFSLRNCIALFWHVEVWTNLISLWLFSFVCKLFIDYLLMALIFALVSFQNFYLYIGFSGHLLHFF